MGDERRLASVPPDVWARTHFGEHPIAVVHTDDKGYHVITTRDVHPGETLLRTRVYAAGIFKNYRKRVCAYCLSACDPATTGLRSLPLRCANCDQCYYCSEACAAADATRGHVRVCSAMRDVLASSKHDPQVDSMVRTVLQVARACATEDGEATPAEIEEGLSRIAPTPNCRAAAPSVVGAHARAVVDAVRGDAGEGDEGPLSPSLTATVTSDGGGGGGVDELEKRLRDALSLVSDVGCGLPSLRYSDLNQLQSHAGTWSRDDSTPYRKAVRSLLTLGLRGMPTTELGYMHLLSRIECNGFGIWGRKEEYMGRAVYPAGSFFNHSCRPNADCARTTGVAHVSAVCAIPVGEEVCINYIDTERPASTRRQHLSDVYRFDCQCARCARELAQNAPPQKNHCKTRQPHTARPVSAPASAANVTISFGVITTPSLGASGGVQHVAANLVPRESAEGSLIPIGGTGSADDSIGAASDAVKISYDKSKSSGKNKHAKPKKKFAFDESVLAARKKQ